MNNNRYQQPTLLPPELLKPGGIMEDLIHYINKTARRKQPVFALSGALALMSLALARRYKSYTGIFPNLYLINIGPTGCGKDHDRKAITKALEKADALKFLGGDRVSSAAAIVARLQEHPKTLYLLDEIGDFLKAVASTRSPQYIKEINSTLLTMFTSSDSVYKGTDYADRTARKNVPIHFPSLSLLGTTTPETFIESLSTKDAASGLLGRLLCFETSDQRPPLNISDSDIEIPDSVVEWLKKAMGSSLSPLSTEDHTASSLKTTKVECTPEAKSILSKLVTKEEQIALSDAPNITKDLCAYSGPT